MSGFSDTMHLKGKVEEDLYFARLDQERAAALQAKHGKPEIEQPAPQSHSKPTQEAGKSDHAA